MLSTPLYFLYKLPLKKKLLRESPSIASKVALNPLFTGSVPDSNLTWMKFPSEYTGEGSFWPQILKSLGFPPWEATFVIKTRALSAGAPAQSSFSPFTRVKLKKVTLMIFPPGTVIFQVQILFLSLLLGKLGLEMWPLVALMDSPGEMQAEKKGIFQLLSWFLTADKRIQANRNWKCVANEHLRYHIFTKNENSSWLKQRRKLLIKMQTCKTNIYTYHHLSPESGRQLQQIQRTNMWTRVST